MSRQLLGQWTVKDKQFIANLKAELGRNGKNYKSLMKLSGRSQSAIYKRYRAPETITVEELRIFIQAANLSKEDITDFLFKDGR